MRELPNRGEEGVSDVSTISVLAQSQKKLASQFFSAFCEARESSIGSINIQ